MTLQEKKLELIQWLAGLESETAIERIRWIKDHPDDETDWWNEISDEEKASIDEGLKDEAEGKFIPHDEVRKIYEKWL